MHAGIFSSVFFLHKCWLVKFWRVNKIYVEKRFLCNNKHFCWLDRFSIHLELRAMFLHVEQKYVHFFLSRSCCCCFWGVENGKWINFFIFDMKSNYIFSSRSKFVALPFPSHIIFAFEMVRLLLFVPIYVWYICLTWSRKNIKLPMKISSEFYGNWSVNFELDK